MSLLIEIIFVVVVLAAVAVASVRWGEEQRPGFGERHPERPGERWAIR
jgi:hypothetical protein